MTKQEFLPIAKGMKSMYSAQHFLEDNTAIEMWYKLLADLDAQLVSAAVQQHICTSRFPPTVADIREACSKVTTVDRKDWLEGWREVTKCIGLYGYYRPQEALKALRSFDVTTGRVAEMLGWQNLCMSENQIADRANFRQAYETIQAREIESAKLPPSVNNLISGISDRLQIGGG